MNKEIDDKILELLGTDMYEWMIGIHNRGYMMADLSASDIGSVVDKLSSYDQARLVNGMSNDDRLRLMVGISDTDLRDVISNLRECDLGRVVSNLSDTKLSRIVSYLSTIELECMVVKLSADGLRRVESVLNPTDMNRIKRIKECLAGVPIIKNPYSKILERLDGGGGLEMEILHTCPTTHCVAGWVIMLAGWKGWELVKMLDWKPVATLLHLRSRPGTPLPNYLASNEAAMAYIKARAKEEKCP